MNHAKKQQALWFVGLWIAGVVVVASIAYAFKWLAHFAYL